MIYAGIQPGDRARRLRAGRADEARARRALALRRRSCARRSAPGRRFTPAAGRRARPRRRRSARRRSPARSRRPPRGSRSRSSSRPMRRCGSDRTRRRRRASRSPPSALGAPAPWEAAAQTRGWRSPTPRRSSSSDDPQAASARRSAARSTAVGAVLAGRPRELADARAALAPRRVRASRAATTAAFAAARAGVWTAIARAPRTSRRRPRPRAATSPRRARWLLVREFRPPTRFSRAAADATLALDRLAERRLGARAAAAAVRDRPARHVRRPAALRRSTSVRRGDRLRLRRARAEPRRLGGRRLLAHRCARPTVAQRGRAPPPREPTRSSPALVREASAGTATALARPASRARSRASAPRRSPTRSSCGAPASSQRFTELVPIEYGRGVRDGRVDARLRDPGGDHVPRRRGRRVRRPRVDPPRAATPPRRGGSKAALATLGDDLAAASARRPGGDARHARGRRRDDALGLAGSVYPERVEGGREDRGLRRHRRDARPRSQAAAAQGDWGRAEQARLEAYGVFELGPEQRLRGLAPALFQEVERLFWYGNGDARRARAADQAQGDRRGDRSDARRARRRARRRPRSASGAGRARASRSSRTARSSSSARASRPC